jgi:hypothetical protein
MNIFQKSLVLLLSWSLVIGAVPVGAASGNQAAQSEAPPTDASATQSPEQLQQLVAPIALCLAKILSACDFNNIRVLPSTGRVR